MRQELTNHIPSHILFSKVLQEQCNLVSPLLKMPCNEKQGTLWTERPSYLNSYISIETNAVIIVWWYYWNALFTCNGYKNKSHDQVGFIQNRFIVLHPKLHYPALCMPYYKTAYRDRVALNDTGSVFQNYLKFSYTSWYKCLNPWKMIFFP